MTDLEELIQYWKDLYAVDYINRSPRTNNLIIQTIKYLTELNDYFKQQRLIIGAPTIPFRRR